MSTPTTPEIGMKYRIVEGEMKGLQGVCINVVESSMGRQWADIHIKDYGNKGFSIRKRASDLRVVDQS